MHDLDGPGNHAVADATIQAASPGFLVVLAPYAEGATGADGLLGVTAAAAGAGASAWVVEGDGWRDVAWLRDASAPTQLVVPGPHTLETDARFVLVSEAGDSALIADGTHVALDGASLVQGNAAPVAVVPAAP